MSSLRASKILNISITPSVGIFSRIVWSTFTTADDFLRFIVVWKPVALLPYLAREFVVN